MRWTTANLWIYRAGNRWQAWRQPQRALRRTLAAAATPPRADAPLLYLANGRLGDALLAAAFTAEYRRWFGPVVAVGRPETEAIVAPLVDRFVPFDPSAGAAAATGPGALAQVAAGGCRAVLGDLHLFHSGWQLLALGAATGAPMFVYDGWIDRQKQAPLRRFPAGAEVIAARTKPARSTDPAELHVFGDLVHYHRSALARLGIAVTLPDRPALPAHLHDSGAADEVGLPAGYVACHAQSSQPKKDWPLADFAKVFAALPDIPFVLLGNDRRAALPPLANVHDRRGQTNVRQAIAIAAGARAFVGIDSGLAHAAAIAHVPTVVVMPAATTGHFFPYPEPFGRHVHAVGSPAHRACAGCGGICALEPLWRSRTTGFPCLRAVADADVVAAVQRLLAPR